jgi:hypothetical protein
VADAYHFIDPFPLNGLTYYRLKQVNRGNGYVFTKTIAVKTGVAKVYPNPVHGQVTIQVYSGEAKQALLQLYNAEGQLIAQKNVECQKGVNQIVWNLGGLVAGNYTLAFTNLPVAPTKLIIQ